MIKKENIYFPLSIANVDVGDITAEKIGAVPITQKGAAGGVATLNADGKLVQMPTVSDIGAAANSHNHSTGEITSGILPIERGGTNADTAAEALENLGGVPKTRTVNNKALSSDISLTASDVDAATLAQGTKADSAIQGVKVNGSLLEPDANKIVDITNFETIEATATPLNGCTFDNKNEVKINGKVVTLNLLVTSPTAFNLNDITVCQLPSDAIPSTTQYFTCGISDGVWSLKGTARCYITSAGNVMVSDSMDSGYKYGRLTFTYVV